MFTGDTESAAADKCTFTTTKNDHGRTALVHFMLHTEGCTLHTKRLY